MLAYKALFFKNCFLVIIFSFFITTISISQTVTTSLKTEIRDASKLEIGFNRRSDKGNWWTDNSFKDLVAEINPDVVRYPGGTQANYWDWRTGQFIQNSGKDWNNKEILKIPQFVSVLPTNTKIVYVVNMARPASGSSVNGNATEEILKSDATLDAKIADMIAAIHTFKEAGKLPYAIELGNEFYFGNEEGGIFHIEEKDGFFYSGWNPAIIAAYQSNDKKEATVVNAKFYLQQCKTIVGTLKAEFPTLKFALTTTKEEANAAARERWNTTIYNELENNSDYATLKDNIYAVTQHHYLNDKYGVQTVITDFTSSKAAIAEGIQYPLDKQSDYDLVPDHYKIWYTEFGEVKHIAEETWASAVRYAAFVYSWLSLGDKVEQLHWHFITDNNVVNAINTPMKLAPVGIAAKLVSQASSNMKEMQEIIFDNNTYSVNNVKSLYGLKFKNDEKETLLIINTNSKNFSSVDIRGLFSFTGDQKMTQHFSNEPYIFGVTQDNNTIKSRDENINGIADIKKFSISVIQVDTPGLSINDNLEEAITIYPNPVKNKVYFSSKNEIKSVTVFGLKGGKILTFNDINNNSIDLSTLNSGVYILKTETSEGIETKKIIKE